MRPVKTRPKFHCDFCSKVSTEAAMERHERICWRNPNRFCDMCKNTGEVTFDHGEGLVERHPCYWCEQRDESILKPLAKFDRREVAMWGGDPSL